MQLSYPPSKVTDRKRDQWVRAATVLASFLLAGRAIAEPPRVARDFTHVARAVEAYFASLPDYQVGDLISRSQIEAALQIVEAESWKATNAKEVVELGLADNSFLVRELSSPAGKKFMRKLARQSGAFARLDRLSTIPRGEMMVRDLIRRPGGDELIQYMTTTKGGHNLGAQMGQVRGGVDLNKPTGRIYTANDLLAELKRAHEKAAR